MTERSRRPFNLSPDCMPSASRGEMNTKPQLPSKLRMELGYNLRIIGGEIKEGAKLFRDDLAKLSILAARGAINSLFRREPKRSR